MFLSLLSDSNQRPLPYRAATTNYLCCDQALEDSKGAGRMGLTRISKLACDIILRCFSFAGAKVGIFSEPAIPEAKKMQKKYQKHVFLGFYTPA